MESAVIANLAIITLDGDPSTIYESEQEMSQQSKNCYFSFTICGFFTQVLRPVLLEEIDVGVVG